MAPTPSLTGGYGLGLVGVLSSGSRPLFSQFGWPVGMQVTG